MGASRQRYFDQWYADMGRTSTKDRLMQRHLGLPEHVRPNNSVPWSGVAEIVEALRLPSGRTLLDLACGRGSIGLEVARRCGARVVGVDFSAVALAVARENAAVAGVEATYVLGDLTATGLAGGSVDAAVCVDSVQYAEPPAAAYDELRRMLRPGGRVVLTGWEPADRADESVPPRLRAVDLAAQLVEAGFTDVRVRERTDWREAERAMWEEAAALDPGDDPALRSLHDEAVRSVAGWHTLRRVMATATAPSRPVGGAATR